MLDLKDNFLFSFDIVLAQTVLSKTEFDCFSDLDKTK